MRIRLVMALVLGSIGAAGAAGAAAANPATPGGCPQGYVAFDRQTGDGSPPSYQQGEQVVASGVLIDTAAGVPHVTLRSQSADGPELGRAAVAADGSWQGLTFTVPREVPDGAYLVYLEARDRNGTMLTGLPYPFRITVGPPSAPKRASAAPKADSDEPSRASRAAVIDAEVRKLRPAVRRASIARPRAAAERPPATDRRPAADARPAADPAGRARVQADGRAGASAASRPEPGLKAGPPAGLRPKVGLPEAPDARTPVAPAREVRDSGRPPVATMALLLVLLAGAGLAGGIARRRRRPPDEQPAGVEPVLVPPGCPVEAELQALLEEDREAPDRDREPALR